MFLVIDNYDSFVHNLARYIARAGADYDVVRNDKITLDDIEKLSPKGIIISPGPCTPKDAGISIPLVKRFGATTPIFGVCLGHQAIGEAYGGTTQQSIAPTHGKSSTIRHDNAAIFNGIPNPLEVGRYHSLITKLPEQSDLETTAILKDKTIMAMQHKSHPVHGVQFHPESILTQDGIKIIDNFVQIAQDWKAQDAA